MCLVIVKKLNGQTEQREVPTPKTFTGEIPKKPLQNTQRGIIGVVHMGDRGRVKFRCY